MTHKTNKTIRTQRTMGYILLTISTLFVALSSTGLFMPRGLSAPEYVLEFDVGTRLPENTDAVLTSVISQTVKNPQALVLITGHTGNTGDEQANYQLSLSRAQVIKDALLNKGVNPELIVTMGSGGTSLLDKEKNETQKSFESRSKRVEIQFVDRSILVKGQSE